MEHLYIKIIHLEPLAGHLYIVRDDYMRTLLYYMPLMQIISWIQGTWSLSVSNMPNRQYEAKPSIVDIFLSTGPLADISYWGRRNLIHRFIIQYKKIFRIHRFIIQLHRTHMSLNIRRHLHTKFKQTIYISISI
jgi:hypothetical protein